MSDFAEQLLQQYDEGAFVDPILMELSGDAGFCNYGYWPPGTSNLVQASCNLVDKLVGLIPNRGDTVLDVACGRGGTTKQLTKHFAPENITAINLSKSQAAITQARVPEAKVLQMNACSLQFADNSFDTVVCVEAAFHFQTRKDFLREALRVLKPGGHLVLSDILGHVRLCETICPPENHVESIADYKALLTEIGFGSLDVTADTSATFHGFYQHVMKRVFRGILSHPDDIDSEMQWMNRLDRWNFFFKDYLFVCAQKPA